MFIDINSLDISEGQTIRQDCPRCKGKNTFTATKRNGCIAYNCYKVSCGRSWCRYNTDQASKWTH